MDNATTTALDVINSRLQELVDLLQAGQLEYTTEEINTFFLERKDDPKDATVAEYQLAAVAKSRLALATRMVAGMLGGKVESGAFMRAGEKVRGYVFSDIRAAGVAATRIVERVVEKKVEIPVERVVEKVVYRDAVAGAKAHVGEQDFKPVVLFPDAPALGSLNKKYIPPAWAKRMEAALEAKKHVALAGPPGIGKSTAPEQYFIRKAQPFVVVNGDAGFRRRDMEGTTEIQNGTTFFRVAEFAAAAVNGWGCILNEVNAADPDALLFINGILEVPHVVNIQGKAYPVHPDFKLVVTFNPSLVGTKPLPQAFIDRFMPIRLGFPERSFLRKLVVAKTGFSENPVWMDRLLDYAERCNEVHTRGVCRYQISPRRLMDVVFLMTTGVTTELREAIQWGVVDAVDSHADRQVLTNLIDSSTGAVRSAGR